VIAVALPPLDCAKTDLSLGERLVNGGIVLALQLLLADMTLYFLHSNKLIQLPPPVAQSIAALPAYPTLSWRNGEEG